MRGATVDDSSDAWAEVEHELYKAEFTPFDLPLKRKLRR